jgi:SAM-dependent methyltransferase
MIDKYRLYISPYFLTRFYLINDVKKITEKYPFYGKILDVGCGNKPYENLFKNKEKYFGIDFKDYSINKDLQSGRPDYFFNKDYLKTFRLPFPDNSFDHSVSFQVLEHHKRPQELIKEMLRITKKNGFILISVPFLGGIHEEPNDYQRFTRFGLIELFEQQNCKILKIIEEGSLISTISMLLNEYLNGFAAKNKLCYMISVIIYPPFLALSYLSLLGDRIFKSKNIFFNYLILAKNN